MQTEMVETDDQACGTDTLSLDGGEDRLTMETDDVQDEVTEDPEWGIEDNSDLDSDDDSEEESDE